PLLRCLLIASVLYLSLTRLNPHCGLINKFWPSRLLISCSRTGVSCQPLVVILTPTIPYFSLIPPFLIILRLDLAN
ncbi:unnamed protein product, partial [Hymenolepis diminuta]